MQVLTGVTSDINSLLNFNWYEPEYYKNKKNFMPNEKSGQFVGISEHIVHALTFFYLADNKQMVIH